MRIMHRQSLSYYNNKYLMNVIMLQLINILIICVCLEDNIVENPAPAISHYLKRLLKRSTIKTAESRMLYSPSVYMCAPCTVANILHFCYNTDIDTKSAFIVLLLIIRILYL